MGYNPAPATRVLSIRASVLKDGMPVQCKCVFWGQEKRTGGFNKEAVAKKDL